MTYHKNWRTLTSSVTGSFHRQNHMPCQDSYLIADTMNLSGHPFICAVSDGVGSAMLAETGARIAVETAVNTLLLKMSNHFTPLGMSTFIDIFCEVRDELNRVSVEQQCSIHELACTLQLVFLSDTRLYVAHIGDGTILGIRPNNQVDVLSTMKEKVFVNSTFSITSDTMLDEIQVTEIQQTNCDVYDGIIMTTDGADVLCVDYASMSAYMPFFTYIFSWIDENRDQTETWFADELTRLFQSEAVELNTSDDITFIYARRLSSYSVM